MPHLSLSIFFIGETFSVTAIFSSVTSKEGQEVHKELDNVNVEEKGTDYVLIQLELLHDQFCVENDIDRGEDDD